MNICVEVIIVDHIAFKCTYNDGDEGYYVGFKGTCSDDTIIYKYITLNLAGCGAEKANVTNTTKVILNYLYQ